MRTFFHSLLYPSHIFFSMLRLLLVLMLPLFFYTDLFAQNILQQSGRSQVAYQCPKNGDTYVPQRTTIIIRPGRAIVGGRSPQDFSFDVQGEQSGLHSGNVVISDDGQTVIFKPDLPFHCSEKVTVHFSVPSEEIFSPLRFSFQITPLSKQERLRRFQLFKEREEAENAVQLQRNTPANDTNHSYEFVIDTIVPSKLAYGDIFTTRNDSRSFIVNLDNTASLIYQHEVFNPPSENFRPWNNKVFSYNYQGKVFLQDSSHAPLDTLFCGNGFLTDDHDFQLLPNGHALLMAYDDRDTDMRLVTGDTNAVSDAIVIGSVIQELDRSKNVIFEWKTWGHLDINEADHVNLIKPNPRLIEYSHLNSIEEDTDGNILASFRAMSVVIKIDTKTGDILWRLGGKKNSFAFIGDTLPFSYQHDARRLPNGNVTIFDNGNYHTTKWGNGTYHDTAWSRAIEYELDEANHTAKAVWQYSDIDPTPFAGNVQRLPNGNTLICSGQFGLQNITEVTSQNEKVFEMKFPAGAFSYRAYRLLQPNSPLFAVRPSDHANSFELHSIYPNPAQNVITIAFSVDRAEEIKIELLDVLGHCVRQMYQTLSDAGTYSGVLDTGELSSGIYYCKISGGGNTVMKPLVIQK